jgi:hypothetical protein
MNWAYICLTALPFITLDLYKKFLNKICQQRRFYYNTKASMLFLLRKSHGLYGGITYWQLKYID